MPKKNESFINSFNEKYSPEYFLNQNGKQFVTFAKEGRGRVTEMIESIKFKNELQLIGRHLGFKLSSKLALDAIKCEMQALSFESNVKKQVDIRVSKNLNDEPVIELDAGNSLYCRIIPERGFKVERSTDATFWSPSKQMPLPMPKESISSDELISVLKKYLNFEDSEYLILLLALLVKMLIKDSGANPIILIEGKQGSGKSLFSMMLKMIIDPTTQNLLSPPKNVEDVLIVANSSYFISYDNNSGINGDLADVFCRLSTGGSVSKRALYTDNDELSYLFQRPVLFNGISELTARPDFLERSILFELKQIAATERISEKRLQESFEKDLPIILGGLYQLVSKVLVVLPSVSDSNLPRMTEYARIGIAVEQCLNLSDGTFLNTYRKNIEEKEGTNFWNDALCCYLYRQLSWKITFGSRNYNSSGHPTTSAASYLYGTASELMDSYNLSGRSSGNSFRYKNIQGFISHLKRITPLLNTMGIEVSRERDSHHRRILIEISQETLDQMKNDKEAMHRDGVVCKVRNNVKARTQKSSQ